MITSWDYILDRLGTMDYIPTQQDENGPENMSKSANQIRAEINAELAAGDAGNPNSGVLLTLDEWETLERARLELVDAARSISNETAALNRALANNQ